MSGIDKAREERLREREWVIRGRNSCYGEENDSELIMMLSRKMVKGMMIRRMVKGQAGLSVPRKTWVYCADLIWFVLKT